MILFQVWSYSEVLLCSDLLTVRISFRSSEDMVHFIHWFVFVACGSTQIPIKLSFSYFAGKGTVILLAGVRRFSSLGWSQVCCDQGLRQQEAAEMSLFISWGCQEAISTSLSPEKPWSYCDGPCLAWVSSSPLPVKVFWHSAVLCSHRCLQRAHWYDSAADLAVILPSAEPKHINRQNTSFRIIRNSGHYSYLIVKELPVDIL